MWELSGRPEVCNAGSGKPTSQLKRVRGYYLPCVLGSSDLLLYETAQSCSKLRITFPVDRVAQIVLLAKAGQNREAEETIQRAIVIGQKPKRAGMRGDRARCEGCELHLQQPNFDWRLFQIVYVEKNQNQSRDRGSLQSRKVLKKTCHGRLLSRDDVFARSTFCLTNSSVFGFLGFLGPYIYDSLKPRMFELRSSFKTTTLSNSVCLSVQFSSNPLHYPLQHKNCLGHAEIIAAVIDCVRKSSWRRRSESNR
jgi:hypothetical protein